MKSQQLRNRILAADLAWIPGRWPPSKPCAPDGTAATFRWGRPILWFMSAARSSSGCCSRKTCIWMGPQRLAVARSGLASSAGGRRAEWCFCSAVGNVSERYVGKLTLSVFSLFLLIGFLGIRGSPCAGYCSATGLDRSTACLSWVLTVWPPNWR